MPKKQQLTPKGSSPPEMPKPTRGNSKGRPKTNLTIYEYYRGVALGGLIARSVGVTLTPEHMEQLKEEANKWADFMTKE